MYTQHAVQRTIERTGRSEESAKEFICKAIDYGTLLRDLPPVQQKWVETKVSCGNTAVVYNHYIFVVGEDGFCITMFEAPTWFDSFRQSHRPKMRSNEPVRHAKRWQKMRKGVYRHS